MPLSNEIIIAAAGGGKTTRIVRRVIDDKTERTALLTFTQVNTDEIRQKFYAEARAVPPHAEVWSWYSFLLAEMARPYQRTLHERRIDNLLWCNQRSARGIAKANVGQYYFWGGRYIYSDKVAEFVVACNAASNGAIIHRLEERFDRLYVDEVQDLAGYDLEVIELLLKSNIKITLVGDHRQATYTTNNNPKNSAFRGVNIVNKFAQWERAGLVVLSYETGTHRCNQKIADFADALFPKIERTRSLSEEVTDHDGIYIVGSKMVDEYVSRYSPQILRYDRRTRCGLFDEHARNFGECKGLTFDRVLIYPNGTAKNWLTTGNFSHIEDSLAKMYVAITRARHSVAYVLDQPAKVQGFSRFPIEST